MRKSFIIGIDEVGRGALAGPVVVAAVLLSQNFKIQNPKSQINSKFHAYLMPTGRQGQAGKIQNSKLKLRDSKKLTPRQREIWFSYIKKSLLSYEIANVSPKIIDKINISQAANLAATKAFRKLIANRKIVNYKIFLDGGLYIQNSKTQKLKNLKTKTIIRGDEKIPAISLASIVAKVHRDKLMKRLHKKYPKYDFINNVGYGVKKHIKALRKFGRSPIHRKSFKF